VRLSIRALDARDKIREKTGRKTSKVNTIKLGAEEFELRNSGMPNNDTP